jgi:4-hydroxyphenylpyruvate dioxygenase
MTATAPRQQAEEAHDTFPINGTDYIEFYVGNAKQASHFYQSAFGFRMVGYRGPETGVRDRASFLLTQGKIYKRELHATGFVSSPEKK